MNARLLAAFLCLTAASTGCIIVDHDHDPPPPPPAQRGDVTFMWTFANAGTAGRCADAPEVKKVRITIPGETLHNGGVYACNTAGVDGIVLHNFAPRGYSYTIEALDYTDRVVYTGSGTFAVNGNTRVNINLTPTGNQSSFAYVSWTFPANTTSPNPTCAQAGVTHVDVRIDNGDWDRLSCEAGSGGKQVSSPYLAPGNHFIELVGVSVTSAGATPYYYANGTLTTLAGSPIAVSYSLWSVGGMALRWELIDGSIAKTCAQSGVTQVAVHLYDEQRKEYVYGNTGDVQRCDGAPIIYRFLRPGYYTVIIEGRGTGDVLYTNRYNSPPSVLVKAYEQKTEGDAFTLYLRKQ